MGTPRNQEEWRERQPLIVEREVLRVGKMSKYELEARAEADALADKLQLTDDKLLETKKRLAALEATVAKLLPKEVAQWTS